MTWYMGLVILFFMLFLHVFEDFHLQGLLGQLKQKIWWSKECEKAKVDLEKYKYDYIVGLCWHCFEWSFCISLPLLVWLFLFNPEYFGWFFILFGFNCVFHGIIDNMKCNQMRINLVWDQILHLGQIFVTWASFMFLV